MQPEIERYREDGLIVILVAGDDKEVIQSVLEEYQLEVITLDDRNNRLEGLFEVSGWPAGFLFDREGRLVDSTLGWSEGSSLPLWRDKVESELSK